MHDDVEKHVKEQAAQDSEAALHDETSNQNNTCTEQSILSAVQNSGSYTLRRGDLIRISEHGLKYTKRLADRAKCLGRITKVHVDDTGLILYDIEWILGGRLSKLCPEELVRTTAESEGMTQVCRRNRQKRNATSFIEETLNAETAKKRAKNEAKAKAIGSDAVLILKKNETEAGVSFSKKNPAKNPTKIKLLTGNAIGKKKNVSKVTTKKSEAIQKSFAKKNVDPRSTTVNDSNLNSTSQDKFDVDLEKEEAPPHIAFSLEEASKTADALIASETGDNKCAQISVTRKTFDKRKNLQQKVGKKRKLEHQEPALLAENQTNALDLYERHRREFERCLSRLEKVDKFGYFFDVVPPEFEEANTEKNETGSSTASFEINQSSDSVQKTKSNTKKQTKPFSSHPPYNWRVVRKRMTDGKYVLDREKLEEDIRFLQFESYYLTLDMKKRPKRGRHQQRKEGDNPRVLHKKGVDWDLFRDDVLGMCQAAFLRAESDDSGKPGSLSYAVNKIKEVMLQIYDRTGKRHMAEMSAADDRHKFSLAIEKHQNTEAAMQTWKKEPYPERKYERLSKDVVCAGLSSVDEQIASYELRTSLNDSFIGLSYKCNDTGQSEAWMKSVVKETGADSTKSSKKPTKRLDQAKQAALAMAADDGVTRAQVSATMQSLLIGVQDRVMTELNVLKQPALRSANWIHAKCSSFEFDEKDEKTASENLFVRNNSGDKPLARSITNIGPDIVEQPVWGIDCYTRRNITACLETEFDTCTALLFIEKWLLPAINACPVDLAHELLYAARLLEGETLDIIENANSTNFNIFTDGLGHHAPLRHALQKKILEFAPPWLKAAASQLRRARMALGPDFFRVHPKGHGSVLLTERVGPNILVTFYRGELYPSWRWGEKLDAIDITQQRKGIKPVLPDFYNMALERPQTDPRGYGLLFVDASRKAGHGSSLSHSCDPTCEVRVAALHGTLCLAMTTIRELEMGEELTFDYNAVTESLNEYRSAVCLCGYGKCRGSFLHFATAECYQQVLNRNAPIASRFSNLVKGCMKKVMAEDDERVLRRHGFGTAVFGAISVNRRQESTDGVLNLADSIDVVPVWLRTYVADTLKYIEYERKALPIALICDHLSSNKLENEETAIDLTKEPKPEPAFLYFLRVESDFILTLLRREGFSDAVTGKQKRFALQKVAANYWQELPDEVKKDWKDKAQAAFEVKKKAWLNAKKSHRCEQPNSKVVAKKKGKPKTTDVLGSSSVSFADADAEGVSAMEQRIQHLTQTLSRIGRVLDRHREVLIEQDESHLPKDAVALRNLVHSPIVVARDEDIIEWLWNSKFGVRKSLLEEVGKAKCTRTIFSQQLRGICLEYSDLDKFGDPVETVFSQPQITGKEGRRLLKAAFLRLRAALTNEVEAMCKAFRRHKQLQKADHVGSDLNQESSCQSMKVEYTRADDIGVDFQNENNVNTISKLVDEMVSEVERRATDSSREQIRVDDNTSSNTNAEIEKDQWIMHYGDRFTLLAAADLLLFYAHTRNFFTLKTFKPLTSTPIEVYARELGNFVPVSARDDFSSRFSKEIASECPEFVSDSPCLPTSKKLDTAAISEDKTCEPDDIIAEVSITYTGDYVLSQLLQWYTGGIGQKPGLPDLLGCALLPKMSDCWSSDLLATNRIKSDRKTTYETKIRRRLIEWLQDPYQRGNPWPDEVKKAFVSGEAAHSKADTSAMWLPFGSPILDFLVTGEEESISAVLYELDADDKVEMKTNCSGLLSSVDKGRPAQAVSNWVQCENPKCLKWRKLPWFVDRDLLPEHFYCKDNEWNPDADCCEVPEEDWDDQDNLLDNDGVMVGPSTIKNKNLSLSPSEVANFYVGARFDVLRTGKSKFTVGTITKLDFGGKVKRVMFHFHKTKPEADEWVDFGSSRIAALNSKTMESGQADKSLAKGKKGNEVGLKKDDTTLSKNVKKTDKESGSIDRCCSDTGKPSKMSRKGKRERDVVLTVKSVTSLSSNLEASQKSSNIVLEKTKKKQLASGNETVQEAMKLSKATRVEETTPLQTKKGQSVTHTINFKRMKTCKNTDPDNQLAKKRTRRLKAVRNEKLNHRDIQVTNSLEREITSINNHIPMEDHLGSLKRSEYAAGQPGANLTAINEDSTSCIQHGFKNVNKYSGRGIGDNFERQDNKANRDIHVKVSNINDNRTSTRENSNFYESFSGNVQRDFEEGTPEQPLNHALNSVSTRTNLQAPFNKVSTERITPQSNDFLVGSSLASEKLSSEKDFDLFHINEFSSHDRNVLSSLREISRSKNLDFALSKVANDENTCSNDNHSGGNNLCVSKSLHESSFPEIVSSSDLQNASSSSDNEFVLYMNNSHKGEYLKKNNFFGSHFAADENQETIKRDHLRASSLGSRQSFSSCFSQSEKPPTVVSLMSNGTPSCASHVDAHAQLTQVNHSHSAKNDLDISQQSTRTPVNPFEQLLTLATLSGAAEACSNNFRDNLSSSDQGLQNYFSQHVAGLNDQSSQVDTNSQSLY